MYRSVARYVKAVMLVLCQQTNSYFSLNLAATWSPFCLSLPRRLVATHLYQLYFSYISHWVNLPESRRCTTHIFHFPSALTVNTVSTASLHFHLCRFRQCLMFLIPKEHFLLDVSISVTILISFPFSF